MYSSLGRLGLFGYDEQFSKIMYNMFKCKLKLLNFLKFSFLHHLQLTFLKIMCKIII